MSTETIQIPDNIPVSWLPNHSQLDPEMLLLVSVPSTETETGFVSKHITFRDLRAGLQEMFQIDNTHAIIEQISGEYFPILDGLSSNSLCCDIDNPYIISAITQKDGNICQLSGYRLSSALNHIHEEVVFDILKAKNVEISGWMLPVDSLSAIINQLPGKVVVISGDANSLDDIVGTPVDNQLVIVGNNQYLRYKGEWIELGNKELREYVSAHYLNWNSVFDTVSSTSSTWNGGSVTVRDLSSGWESTLSTVSSLSDTWSLGLDMVHRSDFDPSNPDSYSDDALIWVYD